MSETKVAENATMKQFRAARRVSVPLIIWKTPDAAATIVEAKKVLGSVPIYQWDIVRGIQPLAEGLQKIDGGVGNPPQALTAAQNMPEHSVLFMHNMQRFIDNSAVIQAVCNLRDTNKGAHRTLVMLTPEMRSPIELANDVFVIDESLPTEEQLRQVIDEQIVFAKEGADKSGKKMQKITEDDLTKATDAINGLSRFSAEQVVAVSFESNGTGVTLNPSTLWDRKRQAIEETRGLRVWRDGETLDDVKGCENVKKFMQQVINGRVPPRAIVFIDEIEKALGGIAGDTSGTSQDQLAVLLTEMQNKHAQGLLFIGHPGSAKSMVAKAAGKSAGVPTIALDLGAMKGQHVGDSEQNIRAAMKVIDAVSQGRALYIATCNNIGVIPPELQRRFTLGTFFFDLPTAEERSSIWQHYISKFKLSEGNAWLPVFSEDGWTGADIFNCCQRAWQFKCSLAEASKYATPICKTRPQQIEALRTVADNAFISANYEGIYQKDPKQAVAKDSGRKMNFD